MNDKQLVYFYKILNSCVTIDQAQSCLKLITYKNTVINAKDKDGFINLLDAFSAARTKIWALMKSNLDNL